jgi:hypothetical protein
MRDVNHNAVRRYLRELENELRRLHVAAADDALSDAREYLQAETLAAQEAGTARTETELYACFVENYGTPREVALGYAESFGSASRPRRSETARRTYWFTAAAAALMILTGTVGLCLAALEEPPKISPFTEVRYEDEEAVAVRVRGQLYQLVSIDGIPTKKILQSARDHFGDLWQKRFAEDLVEVLWAMDHKPGESVRLELIDPKTKKAITIDKAPMTEANRRQIYFARNGDALIKLALSSKSKAPPKLSPFTEVRYESDDVVVVRFRNELYQLVSLDGIPTKRILQSARDQFGGLWQKRFAEDLVEVLWGMDHQPGKTVRLELREPKTDKVITIDDAAMTEENRWQIWEARNNVVFRERRAPGNRREPPKISPFTEVRYEDEEAVAVRVRGEMYRLVSIDGIPTKKILQSARDHFGDVWQKRFAEDLVEVLWAMDHKPGESVRLELIDPKTEKAITIDNAPMTHENRQKIWHARRAED